MRYKLVLAIIYFFSLISDIQASINIEKTYKLNIADTLQITIFNENDLSGNYQVNTQGNIKMPLIGEIGAKNKTVKELEESIIARYKNGYLINPNVRVEILTFEPFFIMGEVNKPGSYQYKGGLTILNAVAIAGGYTYRANKRKILIKRKTSNGREPIKTNESREVLPGDIIIIKERFF